ncbi:MFS transporter [Janthinobacterium fluminis]|uniref:MFS transporter n=1 Tax=Janthinobacterium fluminis TaxID=2987524 RepID=A0ABT5JTR1_9BURK|nr:MFS transporter [Janthinobacterium fluminis]MDC8756093.1 MFS transporter [Janthinobacterium fluminis]
MHTPQHQAAAPPSEQAAEAGLSPWLAVASVGIGAFALVTSEFLPVGLLPAIAAELAITKGQTGLMITTPGIVAAFAAVFVTVGSGRLDRRIVLMALTVLLVLSNLIVALAPSFGWILLGRALLGIGVGGFWAIGTAIGPRLVSPEHAAKAMSVIFAGVSLGTVAGVPAGALVGELIGWRVAFGSASAIALLVLLGQALLLPALPPTQAITLRQLPAILGIRKARLGLIATVLLFVGQFAGYTYIAPFLKLVSGMSATLITTLLLAYGLTGFVGNILGGWAVGKSERGTLIATSLVLGLAALAMPLFGADQIAATVLVGIWGLAFGAMPIAIQTWMYKAAPDLMEGSSALFVATAQIGLASGALLGGLGVDHLGVGSAMVIGGAFAVSCAAVIWKFGHDRVATLKIVGGTDRV